MVIVYVWFPANNLGNNGGLNIGHGSIRIGTGSSTTDMYLSIFPGEGKCIIDGQAKLHTYEEDVAEEGGPESTSVRISWLDERKIIRFCEDFKCNPRYSLTYNNCCGVVADALKQGGGSRFLAATSGVPSSLGIPNIQYFVWTPYRLFAYAKELSLGNR